MSDIQNEHRNVLYAGQTGHMDVPPAEVCSNVRCLRLYKERIGYRRMLCSFGVARVHLVMVSRGTSLTGALSGVSLVFRDVCVCFLENAITHGV